MLLLIIDINFFSLGGYLDERAKWSECADVALADIAPLGVVTHVAPANITPIVVATYVVPTYITPLGVVIDIDPTDIKPLDVVTDIALTNITPLGVASECCNIEKMLKNPFIKLAFY